MRKVIFFLFMFITLTSCISIAPKHHRYVHYFHKRPFINSNWEKKYEAPSKVYRNRDFK